MAYAIIILDLPFTRRGEGHGGVELSLFVDFIIGTHPALFVEVKLIPAYVLCVAFQKRTEEQGSYGEAYHRRRNLCGGSDAEYLLHFRRNFMITPTVKQDGNTSCVLPGGTFRNQITFYATFKTTDDAIMQDGRLYINGEEKLFAGAENADLLLFFNWHVLTTEQKKKIGAQIWMYDEDARKWLPQTAIYTG